MNTVGAMSHSGVRVDANATQTGTTGALEASASLRVVGLTVLYHPDGERIGERTVLGRLHASQGELLARQQPDFAAPGGDRGRPLADLRLSRTPIVLRSESDGIRIDRGESRTRLSVDNREVDVCTTVSANALVDGVVLMIGRRVVLLLHWLDPVTDSATPRFGLIGDSPAMVHLRREILLTADLRVPVLIRGESGTGKELVARAIHDAGSRRERPYVAINMAAMPTTLAAAELFGAERGAYTGAERRRSGHFERAHGGTLFLDEVGETPLEIQALLLRALETGEIQAVGGDRFSKPDARIVAATDADLDAAILAERFRGPLLHRLSGYVLRIPPLRQRREDFGRLFAFFLRRELRELGKAELFHDRPRPWLPAPLVSRLAAWHWPGNVRQLANVVRQLAISNRDADPATRFGEVEALIADDDTPPPAARSVTQPRKQAAELREGEVLESLRAHQFRPAAAADALGIPRSSIYDLMKRIPGLRKASDLSLEEIDEARGRVGPSLEAVASDLEVSQRALRRRLGQLES